MLYPELIPDDEDGKRECSLKILLPGSAISFIMGKRGEALQKLEVNTGTKITISGLKDLYPGTKDRVCMISGNINSVARVNRTIMDKMFSNSDNCCRGNYNTQKYRLYSSLQVKLIIPQSTASKVIGKGGSIIEKMKAESGSFIKLSRKAFPVMLRERCVIVNGEPQNNDIACRMILKIIADETNADYYKNVSYCEANFPLPNASLSGPPFAKAKYNMKLEALPESSINRRELMLFLDHMRQKLVCLGYPEDTATEAAECILTLYNHRVIDICLSLIINYFYPCAQRKKGIVTYRHVPSDAPLETKVAPQNIHSSAFKQGHPTLESCPRPIPANTPILTRIQSSFDHDFASAAPAFPSSSGSSSVESYRSIKIPDADSVPTEEAFWRSVYRLPPFQSTPDGFNRGNAHLE